MKYYRLEHNWNRIKEIGCFPQAPDTMLTVFNTNEIDTRYEIIETLIPPEPILKKSAKPTTLLYVVSLNSLIFLVLKNDFKDFLKDFSIGEYQTWPMKVHHKGEVLDDYHLFHLSHPSDGKYVDFSNSEFLIGKQAIYEDQSIGKPINIENYKNYLNLLELIREEDESLYIQCPKLVLDFSNATEDMIRFAESPQAGYFVSERLRDAVLEKRFTGMDFLEIGEYSKRLEAKNADNIA